MFIHSRTYELCECLWFLVRFFVEPTTNYLFRKRQFFKLPKFTWTGEKLVLCFCWERKSVIEIITSFSWLRDNGCQPGRSFNCLRNLKNWSVLLFVDIHLYFCMWVAGYFLPTGKTRQLYLLAREIYNTKLWLDFREASHPITISLWKWSGQNYRVCLNIGEED